MPYVSVITRTKNRPLTLRRVAASLAAQQFTDFNWIIVNDGGERSCVDAIGRSAGDGGLQVQVIHNERSLGMEAASNIGVQNSTSPYIAILDDDDSWEREFLGTMIPYLEERPHYLAVACQTRIVFESIVGERITKLRTASFNPQLRTIHIVEVLRKAMFTNNALVFRRTAWENVGGFDETLPVTGDWDFSLKLLERGDIGVVPRVLANYHKRLDDTGHTSYANTIIAEVSAHHEYNAILRNKWIRRDLASGRTGLGILFGLARQMELASVSDQNLAVVRDLLDALIADGVTRTIVFGAGEIGHLFLALCAGSGIDCPAVLDNNRQLQGTFIEQIPILPPDAAPGLDCAVVTIASQAFIGSIAGQIEESYRAAGSDVAVYAIRRAARLD